MKQFGHLYAADKQFKCPKMTTAKLEIDRIGKRCRRRLDEKRDDRQLFFDLLPASAGVGGGAVFDLEQTVDDAWKAGSRVRVVNARPEDFVSETINKTH